VIERQDNGAGVVCDQKTSKFFVTHQKESMAGHVGVKGGYLLKARDEKYKEKYGSAQMEVRSQESGSALQVLLKPMRTYGKGRIRRFPPSN
jgi:hypothetical protein